MLRNERGFTLVELIAVLIVVGVIFTVVAYKLNLFTGTATQQMVDHAIIELNNREKLVWTNLKLSFFEGNFDEEIQRLMREKHFDLGNGTTTSLTEDSGSIRIRDVVVGVVRKPATNKHPAVWSRGD